MEKIYVKRREKTHIFNLSFFTNFNYKHVLCQSPTNLLLINCSPNSLLLQTFKTCFLLLFFTTIHWFFFYQTKVFEPHNTIPLALLSNHRLHHIGSLIFLSNHKLPTSPNWFYKRTICMPLPCSKKAKTFTSHALNFFRFLCASKPICITY
jgi:hypothetical protein